MVFLCTLSAVAQRNTIRDYVTITFTPNKADWNYRLKERVTLEVTVRKHNVALPNVELSYEWGPELLEPIERSVVSTGGNGVKTLSFKGLDRPGFMTCKATVVVDGLTYSNYITVGFAPEKLTPTAQLPTDFKDFWDKTLADARQIPLQPLLTPQPELCTPYADVYHIRFQNHQAGSYIYGILSVPKKEGTFPALLRVPGGGVREYKGADKDHFCSRDMVVLEIGIHGIPVNLDPQVYLDLRANALSNYNTLRNDNKEQYYFRKVYTGCVKAIDFLASLPQVDADKIGVYGGSQGGLLALVVGALHEGVKCVASCYPSMAEIGAFQHGRAAGWPQLFADKTETNLTQKLQVAAYYDAVNFARFVKAPTLYILGYNDQVCCPTSTYCVYNVLTSPKELLLPLDCGHWLYPEQVNYMRSWLEKQLK